MRHLELSKHMVNRKFISGERHHWWPKSLSKFWTDDEGRISRIDTKGKISRPTPTSIARITDGHNFKLGSPWNSTFEQVFDCPDGNFPPVVELLESLVKDHRNSAPIGQLGFCPQRCEDLDLQTLCECLVSLAVRSPKFRQGVVSFVKHIRSNIKREEHKPLIAANMKQTYNQIMINASGHGKFLVAFSDNKEFIFGDGFYHNISCGSQYMINTRILIPLTPKIIVLYANPMEYMVEPRLVTLEADDDLVELLNQTIQIYSKDCLFYRYQQPELTDEFLRSEHLVYANDDPIKALVERIPGVKSLRR